MTSLAWPDYRLFEYERMLAARELGSLVGGVPQATADGLRVDREVPLSLIDRLTYLWHDSDDGRPTAQARVELQHRATRSSRSTRQSTRFLVHGLHEYKGKFNPQLARSLINVVDPGATRLIDPFCGSGTTLVEGARLGLDVVGLDKSPMAAWISSLKIAVMMAPSPAEQWTQFDALTRRVLGGLKRPEARAARHLARYDERTGAYLQSWFPASSLTPLLAALDVIDGDRGLPAELARLAISNIVRQVSWQLPEDLRVRRRPAGWTPPDAVQLLRDEFGKSLAALDEVAHHTGSPAVAFEVRNADSTDGALVGGLARDDRRSVIVTSPPYATALPYIDTDRLSLALIGLSRADELRALEASLTGAREWNRADAGRWTERRAADADRLPGELLSLLDRIAAANTRDGAGFRRRDVPSLLYRYFADMAGALDAWRGVLRLGERAVLVVGTNRTGPAGDRILIDTPALLARVAQTRGYRHVESLGLEAWPRFGLHSANAVATESAIVLERTT